MEPRSPGGKQPLRAHLVPHDGQEVHAQALHIHAPLPQGLRGIRVQEDSRQPGSRPLLVQGFHSPADLRDGLKRENQELGMLLGSDVNRMKERGHEQGQTKNTAELQAEEEAQPRGWTDRQG